MNTDVLHLTVFVVSMGLIGVGCWWISPALSLVVIGALLLGLVYKARTVKDGHDARADQ